MTYYGWLNTSDVHLHRFDLLILDGTDVTLVEQYDFVEMAREGGAEVYMYLSEADRPVGLGSSYRVWVAEGEGLLNERVLGWRKYVMELISRYSGRVDGVFLDECDPAYFTDDLNPSNPLVRAFDESLRLFVSHAHSLGLKVFINGVRAYAGYGDYYLWESWGSTWRDGRYRYVSDFFKLAEAKNPYDWINGYAKWRYLKEHGLLNRTIAHSYADPSDLSMIMFDYLFARAMGLAGWSFANIENFAMGGGLPPMPIIPLGSPIDPQPSMELERGVVSRAFTGGIVEVYVGKGEYRLELPYKLEARSIAVDGDLSDWEENIGCAPGGSVAGLDIAGCGYLGNGHHSFFYIKVSEPLEGNGWWIFIDHDLNPETGYRNPDIGVVGADYLAEIYLSGGGMVGRYNEKTGWFDSEAFIYVSVGGGGMVVEAALPGRYIALEGSRIWFATITRDWEPGDVEPEGGVEVRQTFQPIPPVYYSRRFCERPEDLLAWGRFTSGGGYAIELNGSPPKTIKLFLRISPDTALVKMDSTFLRRVGDCGSLDIGSWCVKPHKDGLFLYTLAIGGRGEVVIEPGGTTVTQASPGSWTSQQGTETSVRTTFTTTATGTPTSASVTTVEGVTRWMYIVVVIVVVLGAAALVAVERFLKRT